MLYAASAFCLFQVLAHTDAAEINQAGLESEQSAQAHQLHALTEAIRCPVTIHDW